ncbi:MAG TPA: cyclic nucleotide-binding protein [Desulfobacteraceae bacterium]|nr:cyclic nucleotide-binding protein [Desulfobacteraceae bacterium]
MKKIHVTRGITWVEIPEADLYLMCGCPEDSVKHLMKRGLILPTEKKGVPCETGPNAILLSDLSIQNGNFANLAEFPILHMLYRQGMIMPGHPNNTGEKPMLIGLPEQVRAQARYIYRGNYGLISEEEMIQAGATKEEARDMMRLKLRFAFGEIRETEELVDIRSVGLREVELKNGVFLSRIGLNVYQITYKNESVEVDLNLPPNERYESPYQLGAYHIRKNYFSVIHIGEGNGWDINRGCMSSIISFQGRIYLIDAPPNIHHTLTALGFSINEVEGIFHTHAHDDHFAGLTTLIRSGRRIKYYATPLVRASVVKKLSTLMSLKEEMFANYFDIRDLTFDQWNDIEGLEVKPVFSPHPVETSVLFFRTLWGSGYKTYAHLADIVDFELFEKMITDTPEENGVTREFYNKTIREYLVPADIKKIDNGGGLIHGRAEDFVNDKSHRILLSHSELELSDTHREIGSNAVFGMEDVLIPTKQNYNRRNAHDFLTQYFPEVPKYQLMALLNGPVETFNAGSILIRKNQENQDAFLILSGVLEFLDVDHATHFTLSVGSLIGEYATLTRQPSEGTLRAASYVDALRIPGGLLRAFAEKNKLQAKIISTHKANVFLQSTWLLGEMISYATQNRIVEAMETVVVDKGANLAWNDEPELIMLESGKLKISYGNTVIDLNKPGDFFGEESLILGTMAPFNAEVIQKSVIRRIPGHVLADIPIVQWKLLGIFEARSRFVPSAPTNLTAAPTGRSVALQWIDNSNNERGFRVMRKTETEDRFSEIKFLSAETTAFTDHVPEPGVYHYCVKSIDKEGYSLRSNEVRAVVKN